MRPQQVSSPIPEELVHKVAVAIHESAHMDTFRARAIRVLEAIGFSVLRQENAQLQAKLEDFQLSQDAIEKAHEAYHAHGWNLTEAIKVACAIEFSALRSELQAAQQKINAKS